MIREFQIEREPSLFVNAVVKNAFLAAGVNLYLKTKNIKRLIFNFRYLE